MDDFIPPKPPLGLDDTKKDLDNTEDKSISNNGAEDVPKKKGFFSKIFGSDKSKKVDDKDMSKLDIEESDTVESLKELEEDLFKEDNSDVSIDDVSEKKTKSDKKSKSAKQSADDLEKDLFSSDDEFSKELKIEDSDDLFSDDDLLKESKSGSDDDFSSLSDPVDGDDLENIRTALGVKKPSSKSIREKFEDNPDDFANDVVKKPKKSKVSKKVVKKNKAGSLDWNEDSQLEDNKPEEFVKEPVNKKVDNVSKKVSKKVGKKVDKKVSKKPAKNVNKKLDNKLSEKVDNKKVKIVKTKKVSKSVKKAIKKPVKPVVKKESKKESNKKLNKESLKVDDERNDLPVFDFKSIDSAKSKESINLFNQTTASFEKIGNLSEMKISKLITDAASKKKNDLLNKKREKLLLIGFENKVKQIISNQIKALVREEKKVTEITLKKAKELDNKILSFDKKYASLLKKEESTDARIAELNIKVSDLDSVLAHKALSLEKINAVIDKKHEESKELDKKNSDLKNQLDLIRASLKKAKEENTKTLINLKKEYDSKNSLLVEEHKKLLNKIDSSNKELDASIKKNDKSKKDAKLALNKLALKEKSVDDKIKKLNTLIEEEKKVLRCLKESEDDKFVDNDKEVDFESDDLSFDPSNVKVSVYDDLDVLISKCTNLINDGLIGESKLLYNDLRQAFLSVDLPEEDKAKLKSKIKTLYEKILEAS